MTQAKKRDKKHQVRRDESGRPLQDNLLPLSENERGTGRAPAADEGEGVDRAVLQDDELRLTSTGSGGATESDGRVLHHEGTHLGNQPNS